MPKATLLLVEDDKLTRIGVRDYLVAQGYSVIEAATGEEGAERLADKPDVVVLDLVLEPKTGKQGAEVLDEIRRNPQTRDTPVLILTSRSEDDEIETVNKASDYLAKPFSTKVLNERIRKLLKQAKPYPRDADESWLTLYAVNGHRIHAKASGKINNEVFGDSININAGAYAKFSAPDPDWRAKARDKGHQLYEHLIGKHASVLALYAQIKDENPLRIRTRCLREFLELPLESLVDAPIGEFGDYFVLRHSVARSLFQVASKRGPIDRDFLNGLHDRGEKLRVLLIASDTPDPDIPGVDVEARELAMLLPEVFERKRIEVDITFLPTHLATYTRAKKELKSDKYHIIHYAGHGRHQSENPDESCLFFWDQESRQAAVKELRATELSFLLRDSSARFLYLSCCEGGASASATRGVNNDFLGIAEGAVNRGVPAVLAYRWPVPDGRALTLARTFYRELADDGRLDVALMRARREVAGEDMNDRTWLSPILFMQS
jgi:CheY-like chemotaxis protein